MTMTRGEAADLIRRMAQSLENEPRQFQFAVSVTGASVEVTGAGGVGVNAIAMGGEAGSSTVGFSVNATSGGVEIANARINEEIAEAVRALRELSDAVAEGDDTGRIRQSLERLTKASIVPAMIVDVANFALGLAEIVP